VKLHCSASARKARNWRVERSGSFTAVLSGLGQLAY